MTLQRLHAIADSVIRKLPTKYTAPMKAVYSVTIVTYNAPRKKVVLDVIDDWGLFIRLDGQRVALTDQVLNTFL